MSKRWLLVILLVVAIALGLVFAGPLSQEQPAQAGGYSMGGYQ